MFGSADFLDANMTKTKTTVSILRFHSPISGVTAKESNARDGRAWSHCYNVLITVLLQLKLPVCAMILMEESKELRQEDGEL